MTQAGGDTERVEQWCRDAERGTWSLSLQGQLLRLKKSTGKKREWQAKRGKACGVLTPSSRIRMIQMNARIDWARVASARFITLTYPDPVAERSYTQRTCDRSRMQRYIEKHVGANVPVIWRTEWAIRKSGDREGQVLPHLHMLALTDKFIHYTYVNEWWKTILGWEGYVRTECKAANDGKHAAKYLSKYVAKLDCLSLVNATYLNKVDGRAWGVCRKSLIPWSPVREIASMPPRDAAACWDHARRAYKRIGESSGTGFFLLGDNARHVFDAAERKAIDGRMIHVYIG